MTETLLQYYKAPNIDLLQRLDSRTSIFIQSVGSLVGRVLGVIPQTSQPRDRRGSSNSLDE